MGRRQCFIAGDFAVVGIDQDKIGESAANIEAKTIIASSAICAGRQAGGRVLRTGSTHRVG